ncbi:MAG: single-stranded-DNA-specific exonuclease RecJ [Anaerolineales bacterium]
MKWIEVPRPQTSEELVSAAGGNQLVAEILASRGITNPDEARAFIDPQSYHPSLPVEMPGMDEAVNILENAIRKGSRIGIWGDFDVDGQTSTTLLVSALRMLGADVVYHIPIRAIESHGVNVKNLAKMIDKGVELVVTCDTGISAHEAVQYARGRNIKFIISDHHDLPVKLPEADVIINPKLLPEKHPLSTLPGVGVAYKLIEGLFHSQGRTEDLEGFLDLVALGIVADIALLHGDTRYLLQCGLNILRNTNRLGLEIMFENAELLQPGLTEEDISYSIAPRLNSLGRLGDANGIVDFLTSNQESKVRVFANRLEGLNAQRKLLTSQVFQAAITQLEREPSLVTNSALVLANQYWPAGVLGIVASRLVERYHKPAILLTMDDKGMAHGSARSVPGCDISRAITACHDLLESYGGHPMAAGLGLKASQIDRFRERFNEEVEFQLGREETEPELVYDLLLDLNDISLSLVEQFESLAPFGPGNPPLVFVSKNLKLISHGYIGRTEEHLQLIVEDELGVQRRVVWWQGAGWDLPNGVFDLAFSARKNIFKGEYDVLVELIDFRVIEPEPVDIPGFEIEVEDLRMTANPEEGLLRILTEKSGVVVWSEALDMSQYGGRGRHELAEGDVLVIWHCPPNLASLRSVIEEVNSKLIIVFGIKPDLDDFDLFISRLAGLCKFVITKKNGRTNLVELASAMAHTEATIRLGLEWLVASGKVIIQNEDAGNLVINRGKELSMDNHTNLDVIMEQLNPLLREAKAFRKYFKDCSFDQLKALICNR